MSAQSQFFQDSLGQVVESTWENPSVASASLKIQQFLKVPKNGAGLEKSSWRTPVLIGLSLISLLMTTACSGPLGEQEGSAGQQPEILVSTEVGSPVGSPASMESLPFSSEAAVESSGTFSERQRVVSGWLKFVRQEKVADLITLNSSRESAGESLPLVDTASLDSDLKSLVDVSTVNWPEFRRWRQLVASSVLDSKALDSVAVLLTVSTSPEELQNVDLLLADSPEKILIETEGLAGY